MARMSCIGLTLLGLSLFQLTGCVAQDKYNAQKLALDAANERLARADANERAARAEADAYRRQYEAVMANAGNQSGMVANLTSQNAELQRQLDELNRQYADAVNRAAPVTVLAPELNEALNQFALQNPDLVDFDSTRGIVKFKSDVTFPVGSADITERARTPINKFAQILNSQAARGYELMVAGHTDSQPVSNPETKRRGHLDNWYLSSHRAISVSSALQSQGVQAQRIGVVGYADQRPVASNASDAGRQQNRRVEVLILPTQVRSAVAEAAPAQGGNRQAAQPNLNKDTLGSVDRAPAFNK